MKSQLGQALFVIACDQALEAQEHTEIAAAYLEMCNAEKFNMVYLAQKIVHSFEHTHLFLKDYQVQFFVII